MDNNCYAEKLRMSTRAALYPNLAQTPSFSSFIPFPKENAFTTPAFLSLPLR